MKKFIGVLLIFTAFIGLAFYINNTAEESTNIFIIFPQKTTPLERGSAVYPDIDDLTFEGIEGFSFYFARGAGAWCTEILMLSNGAFTGYH